MARALRAFVSYRRRDAFMQGTLPGQPNSFIEQLKAALALLKFEAVFVDTTEIKAGDLFEGRIYKAIANSDLFISLIGNNWLSIFNANRGKLDVLDWEHATALKLEKDIVPLLIDGATMPTQEELKDEEIQAICEIDAKSVASHASAAELAEVLRQSAEDALRERRFGWGWTLGYFAASLLIWLCCGIVTNRVGAVEFGWDAWVGMATTW